MFSKVYELILKYFNVYREENIMAKSDSLIELVKSYPMFRLGAGISNKNAKDQLEETTFVARLQIELFNEGSVDEDNPFWDSEDTEGIKRTDPKAIVMWTDGDFGKWTDEAVKYFQSRHVDWDGEYLEVDGIVGPKTWWALYSRYSDRDDIPAEPEEVTMAAAVPESDSIRKKVLDTAYKYLGVKEKPRGSNRGKEVDYFKGNTARWAWCQCFVGRVYKDVTGRYPVGPADKSPLRWANDPGTARCRAYAKALGFFKSKRVGCKVGDPDAPEIGDMYSMYYGAGRGHTGFVSGLKIDRDGVIIGIYTISGNENDSVKEGYRPFSSKTLVGFIDPYEGSDKLPQFDRNFERLKDSTEDKTT